MKSRLASLECARCGNQHDAGELHHRCDCGGTLLCRYDLGPLDLDEVRQRPADMWRFRELLPVEGEPVSLGEPATPLLTVPKLSERLGVEAHLKDDGPLPGGTFKARGAGVGLSRARELGVGRVVMPSAGNAGGAWALYGARAGMHVTVTMAESAPAANQTEVEAAGGELVLIRGTIADAAVRAREIADETGAFLSATFSEPYRLEGKKTCWLEVFNALGDDNGMRLPRTIVLPVGGGVAAIAAAKAAEEVIALGWTSDPPPRLVGVQSSGCCPIVRAFDAGADEVGRWDGAAMTIAAGLRVPAPSEGDLVLKHIRASGGTMVAVDESAIVDAVWDLASTEGVFACPEGAATVAAASTLAEEGGLEGPVVLYNTGSGVKYVEALKAFG
ncbi:MAG: threonine synthase [Actinomycetota bacterium]|nr:threonine synthase [Actinomycetota bacterium]